jgi:L-seryl-tRNA(Ser) seleniumtransferase
MQSEFQSRADRIASQLKKIPTLEARTAKMPVANQVPHLLLRYDQSKVKITPKQVADELRHGTPSIELNPQTGDKEGRGLGSDENTIVVGVWMLQPGEDMIVAKRLNEVLSKAIAS